MTQALRMHALRFRSQRIFWNERLQVFAAAAVNSTSIIIWRKSLRYEASNSFQLKIDKNTFFTDTGGYGLTSPAFGHETEKQKTFTNVKQISFRRANDTHTIGSVQTIQRRAME